MSRTVSIAGFLIHDTTRAAFSRFLNRRIALNRPVTVVFANANSVVRCRGLCERHPPSAASLVIVNDGIALSTAVRARRGFRFRENMNGTDLTPHFLRNCRPSTRLFLYGATPASVAGAARVFAGYGNIEIVGAADGYSPLDVEALNAARPDALLVGLGNPLQEEWLLRNDAAIRAPVRMAVGALFDFVSGHARRAPERVQRLHLEWAYRLAREPRRLLRRYTLDTLHFFWLVVARS